MLNLGDIVTPRKSTYWRIYGRKIYRNKICSCKPEKFCGKVWYSKKEKMDLKQVSVKQTGKSQKKYCIKINNFEINLNKKLPKFQKYDTINEDKKLKLFSDFYLPITLGISTYYELEEENKIYTREEAKEILTEKLKNELSEEIENKDNIKDIQINTNENNVFIEVEVIYEVLESIGTEEKI